MMSLGCKVLCLCGDRLESEQLDDHYIQCETLRDKKKHEAAHTMLSLQSTNTTNDKK